MTAVWKARPRLAALVPMRHSSERVPGKNYRLFAGRPLYHRIITTLLECSLVDEIMIDTDSPVIMDDAAKNFPAVRVIERPEEIRGGDVPMNTILLHDTSMITADWYLQTHSTNPLLKSETITRAIEAFYASLPARDSLFSVTRMQTRFWDKDARPVNHDPGVLLRTQDLPPIFEENSNIYIFNRENLAAMGNRIGKRPLMFEMERLEAIDIDEEDDFKIAELLYREKTGG
jgi:CMP-N-acetylneuraminic acid synthetase